MQNSNSEEVATNIEQTSVIAKEIEKMSVDALREVDGLVKTAEVLRDSTAEFKTAKDLIIPETVGILCPRHNTGIAIKEVNLKVCGPLRNPG